MIARLALALALAAPPAAAAAQDRGMADMPGMAMGHDHAATPASGASAAGPAAPAAPPPVPADHYADRDFPPAAMAAARADMMRENGGQTLHRILLNLAEVQPGRGRDGYRWDGEAWLGGDVDRAVLKSEGEGAFGGRIGAAEAQALWSHAIGPSFDLQGGVRQDLGRAARRTALSLGFEGIAPYMLQVEARLFVATTGLVRGRLEGWYDQRLTQRLVLQPRVELNLAARDDGAARVGAGFSGAELGLRLRYELDRAFAPYLGVSRDARIGRTARYARAAGEDATATRLVAGVRFWF